MMETLYTEILLLQWCLDIHLLTVSIRLRSNGKSPASRHFVSLPQDIAKEIQKIQATVPKKRGWGAVKVQAHIGFVKWKTSIFPDKKNNSYLLPLKKEVRKSLHLSEGDEVAVVLTLL